MGAIKWVRLNGMGVIKQDGSHPIWYQLAVQIYIYIGVALYAFLGKKKRNWDSQRCSPPYYCDIG